MNFIDTDLVIQTREGARLNEIIATHGIEAFLRCEEEALLSVQVEDAVISTGGSAVYSDAAMQHLSQKGRIVYLKVELEDLKKRLSNMKERGVVLRPGETIEDLYETRTKLYEKYADITVTETGISIEDTVAGVLDALKDEAKGDRLA